MGGYLCDFVAFLLNDEDLLRAWCSVALFYSVCMACEMLLSQLFPTPNFCYFFSKVG